MEELLEFLLESNKIVSALLAAISAIAEIVAVFQFIKSKEKKPVKIFIYSFERATFKDWRNPGC